MKCEGAECLSFMLGLETCLLEEIDISDNFIQNKGAQALLEVLDPGTKTETEPTFQTPS